MTSERVRKIKDFLELFIFRYKESLSPDEGLSEVHPRDR